MLYTMNYTYELTRLLQFVREIYSNCRQNSHDLANRLVVSKALISTALADLNDGEIDMLIESLELERYILSNGNGQLIFPASLIEKDTWINSYANYNAA